jgi:NAD(P)-dependent dehydrogenase (short-subunit alcohol dehydrogenase family)
VSRSRSSSNILLLPQSHEANITECLGESLLKRWGTSDEVARATRFLLSEDSSNITDTELITDGGVRLS